MTHSNIYARLCNDELAQMDKPTGPQQTLKEGLALLQVQSIYRKTKTTKGEALAEIWISRGSAPDRRARRNRAWADYGIKRGGLFQQTVTRKATPYRFLGWVNGKITVLEEVTPRGKRKVYHNPPR